MELGRDELLMFAELTEVMKYGDGEAAYIVAWESSGGTIELDDSQCHKVGKTARKDQRTEDFRLELRNRERSVRKKSEQVGIRYMVPMVRSEIVGWLRENYDPNAKGPRFAQQQKMLDLVVKALPEEREAGGTMLADMVAALAQRLSAQDAAKLGQPGAEEPVDESELRFQ